jgi:hypothetical protein
MADAKPVVRDITVKGVPMTIYFTWYPPYDATQDEPGFDGEIDIESVMIDEFDVFALMGEKSLKDIEDELWKLV